MMKIKQFAKPENQECQLGKLSWSVPRLFELSRDLKVMDIPIDHLNVYSTYKNLTLRELAGHVRAVIDADLSYPIILDEDGEIMDGRHRIMKALIDGEKTIKAVKFDENPNPCSVKD